MKRHVFALLVLLSAPLLFGDSAWAQLDMLRNLTGGGDGTKEIAYFKIKNMPAQGVPSSGSYRCWPACSCSEVRAGTIVPL